MALGQLVDPAGPKTQLHGPARVYGDLAVDGQLTSRGGGPLPYAIALVTYNNLTTSWTTINLPAERFTLPPLLFPATANGESNNVPIYSRNVTATSFQAMRSGANQTGLARWLAIQMLPDSAAG